MTQVFYIITTFFDFSLSFILVLFCISVLIYLVRDLKYSFFFVVTIFSTIVLVYFAKLTFNVSRPTEAVISAFGQSFPSYHATISTVFFVLLMYIFDDYLLGAWKKFFNIFCVLAILFVAISRVYLGVHWVSDVFFGLVFGSLISYIAIFIFRKFYMSL